LKIFYSLHTLHCLYVVLKKTAFWNMTNDGDRTHLWNVDLVLRDYTAPLPRKLSSLYSPSWESVISLSWYSCYNYWSFVKIGEQIRMALYWMMNSFLTSEGRLYWKIICWNNLSNYFHNSLRFVAFPQPFTNVPPKSERDIDWLKKWLSHLIHDSPRQYSHILYGLAINLLFLYMYRVHDHSCTWKRVHTWHKTGGVSEAR
jgi:hypothetical protein